MASDRQVPDSSPTDYQIVRVPCYEADCDECGRPIYRVVAVDGPHFPSKNLCRSCYRKWFLAFVETNEEGL